MSLLFSLRGKMSKFPIQAKNNYIIGLPSEQATDGKPYTVVETQNKQQYIEVLSVGEDVKSCKAGDRILPIGQQFQAFQHDGKQHLIIEDHQVFGVWADV